MVVSSKTQQIGKKTFWEEGMISDISHNDILTREIYRIVKKGILLIEINEQLETSKIHII